MTDPDARRRVVDVIRGRARSRGTSGPAQPTDGESPAPVLTVVIPVYNVGPYLAECLDSVLGQSLADLEVIAVDDGSTDDCLEILEAYAARDPRLRVRTQENAGQGAARNLGVAEARGEFLTFCDSDDTVPRRAYKAMVRTLRRSGSDFVVGAAQRTRHGVPRQVAWGRTVHEVDRIGTTIDEFPAAMQDIIACNRVFRTAFWRDRIGGFGARTAYEDHVPMLAAYVRAERFDVLARVTYLWRAREDLTSTGQQKAVTQNLLDRITVKEQAYDLLRAEASEATYDAWVGRCLDIDFPPFLPHALTGPEEYRDALATTYRTFLDRATPRALRTVRHDRAIRAWLCAERRWDDLALADEHFRGAGQPAVRVIGDRLFAEPDLPSPVGDVVPPELWSLADSETTLRTGLRWVAVDGATVRLSLWALVPGLGTAERAGDLDAWLVDGTGTVVPLAVTPVADLEVDQWAQDGHVSHLHSAFDASADLAALAGAAPTTWTLRLRLRHGQVVRESGVYDAVDGSPAQVLRAEVGDAGGTPVQVKPGWDPASGFRLTVGPAGAGDEDVDRSPAIRVDRLELASGAIVVEAAATALDEDEIATVRWRGRHLDLPATSTEMVGESVRLRFATTTTAPYGVETLAPNGRYTLVVSTRDGGDVEATAGPTLARALPRSRVVGDHRLTQRLRSDGTLVALLGAPLDDEERRPDVQQRSRRAHQQRTDRPSPAPAVLLHVAGGGVGDSPASLDAALARLRPDVARHWAVRDRSVVVPEGASAVLVGSREWYALLSSAPMLWTSGELPAFFVRDPGQHTLQTFAGIPTEPIGVSAWRARGQSARAVALELARRHQQWHSLVAPSEAVAELYRRELEFDGPVLVTGSPRYDGLVGRDRDRVRGALLARLGVSPDHRVVLYAPTPRDRTHPLFRSAPAELDVRRLAAALGDGHLLLTLGVRRLEGTAPGAARVVDVTHGPAIDDLLLAADAAVLDHSDLRFDWALTGRAAIFHVPGQDVAALAGFDGTAAGPQVADLDGVVDHLRDLEGLRDGYAEAVAELNRTHHALHDGHAGERVVRALLGSVD